jgi:hypothetical protein
LRLFGQPRIFLLRNIQLSKKTTPEKPPSKQMESIAGKGLAKGKLSVQQTKSLSARVLSEGSAVSRKK